MGCGSGILSFTALQLGAARSVAVDIDDDVLEHTKRNAELNGFNLELHHARSVIPGFVEADVCCANILVGQLTRPSMVATLALSTQELCLSGIQPTEADVLLKAYEDFFDFYDYKEKEADNEYWGTWVRLLGRRKQFDRSLLNID